MGFPMATGFAYDEPAIYERLQITCSTRFRTSISATELQGRFYSLPALEKAGVGPVSRLPVVHPAGAGGGAAQLRRQEGDGEKHPGTGQWQPKAARTEEIPFIVARIVLQDFTGVPLLVDLAAMRSAVARYGQEPEDDRAAGAGGSGGGPFRAGGFCGQGGCVLQNLEIEFERNRERYQFLKWGMQAFETFKVVPPGIGIVHQVNLEYLAKGVLAGNGNGRFYPDTLVGTDSHTTMINGLGIVGWGVGGIEAEAGMLGQPVYFLTPDVVGVHLIGALARRRDGHGPGADGDGDVAQGEGGGEVCGILRAGRDGADGGGPGDDCEHGAGIRRDDGLFPMDAECVELFAGDGPERGALPDL